METSLVRALDLAMKILRKSKPLFFIVLLTGFVIDQLTKFFAEKYLFSSLEIIPGWLYFTLKYNTGSAWSLFSGNAQILALAGLVVIVLTTVYFLLKRSTIENSGTWGLVLAGVLGNTVDRLWHGYVVDFIDVNLQIYRWPTFNIADIAINVGVLMILLKAFTLTKNN